MTDIHSLTDAELQNLAVHGDSNAEEALLEGSLSRKERKTKVDKVAAALILEQWLKENKS